MSLQPDVFALSALGTDALHGSVTKLTAAELEFLVRVDGTLSLEQIRESMGAPPESFGAVVLGMQKRGLLVPVQVDPLALRMQQSLNLFSQPTGQAAADTGVSSLRTSGFFVEIARERLPVRIRQPGEILSAVVVEDEPTLARFIQSYLAFEGFAVRLASTRSEIAAELSKRPAPDVILLDVLLPDADGFDVLHRLRQHKALSNVPVIMLTGKATREAVLKGMAGGADGYVTKPFEADALMRAVRTVVGLPEPAKPEQEQDNDPWRNRDARFWKS